MRKPLLPMGSAIRYVRHGSPVNVPCRCQIPLGTGGEILAVWPGQAQAIHRKGACQDLYEVAFVGYAPHMCCDLDIEPLD
jgi:hypothetical protein